MRILDLFSRGQIAYLPRNLPKELNSLEFRIVKICREYRLDNGLGPVEGIHKVVMHPDSVWSDSHRCSVYFIDGNGCLGHWRYGDENWTYLDDPRDSGGYDDIAVYGGRVCVVDKFGSVWQIDSSFWLGCFPSPISGGNHGRCWKYLVVSSGDLYLVDKCIRHGANESRPIRAVNTRAHDFRVYRLDRPRARWEEVRSLGNSAFFLCDRCSFAVPACKLGRRDGNCIYYTEEAVSSNSSSKDVRVFSLADRTSKFLNFSDFPPGMTR
ncbi:hypothetical protein BT93_J1875 [Corymbia citriodora subsp. variegata]|nr:hypothetical protein BT93_J1875 [Corymbia citriodora subsp. variegata]